jgi:hypothetical protein
MIAIGFALERVSSTGRFGSQLALDDLHPAAGRSPYAKVSAARSGRFSANGKATAGAGHVPSP